VQKNHGIASLILSWQDHFKVKEKRKTRLEIDRIALIARDAHLFSCWNNGGITRTERRSRGIRYDISDVTQLNAMDEWRNSKIARPTSRAARRGSVKPIFHVSYDKVFQTCWLAVG